MKRINDTRLKELAAKMRGLGRYLGHMADSYERWTPVDGVSEKANAVNKLLGPMRHAEKELEAVRAASKRGRGK